LAAFAGKPLPEMRTAVSGASDVPTYFNYASDVFDHWVRTRPDAPALWCVQARNLEERRFTFAELAALSRRAANVLRASGVRRGEHVLLLLPRVPEWWIAMLGLIRLGAVPVPATLLFTPREVAFRLASGDARAVITNEAGLGKTEGFDGLRFLIGGGQPGWLDFDDALRRASAEFTDERTRSDDPGMLFFTSATTGDPKMVMHTQASYGLGHRVTGELWLDLKPDDVHWNVSDLGWAKAAWSSFFGPWHMGACVFALEFQGRFRPSVALDVLAQFPITTWCAPPTALRLIMHENLARWQFPRLRHCVTAGEPLNPEVLNRWQNATGLRLHEAYGQTETTVLTGNFRSLGRPVRPGSMGQAAPGVELDLLDETLHEAPAGHEGEVAVRVRPHRPVGLFREYWRNPAETAGRFRGAWYLTGDRAVRDAEGYFWFIGRQDDVIKSSGYRIGPAEVENALLEHAAVLDVAVVGAPDEIRGQIVKAYVVLAGNTSPSVELKNELQHHCRQAIAAYKSPRAIEFVDELPKTTSGKTRRFELRRRSDQG
jgi:acetyl-CoA synthetase/medium-chain acyl-CoA synthetase